MKTPLNKELENQANGKYSSLNVRLVLPSLGRGAVTHQFLNAPDAFIASRTGASVLYFTSPQLGKA